MAELSDFEIVSLVGGADCGLHHHESDRLVTHEQVLQYQDQEGLKVVTASSAVTYEEDYLFVDSTAAPVVLTLPVARGGKFFCIVRIAGANSVTVNPAGSDTVGGASSQVVTTSQSPLRLKALRDFGWVKV